MIPAKYEQVAFIFFVSICMSCVVSGVSVLNTAGLIEKFFGLWMTAWLKSWIIAFPSLLIIAPLVRRFVDKLLTKEYRLAQNEHLDEKKHQFLSKAQSLLLRESNVVCLPCLHTC